MFDNIYSDYKMHTKIKKATLALVDSHRTLRVIIDESFNHMQKLEHQAEQADYRMVAARDKLRDLRQRIMEQAANAPPKGEAAPPAYIKT